MRHLILILVVFIALLTFASCSKKDIKYKVTFDFITNINNNDDIALLINQRLIVKDSIDFKIIVNDKKCCIDFYCDIDTSLISRLLTNQLDDGYYILHQNEAIYQSLLILNDSIYSTSRRKIIKELENKVKNVETLLDEVSISKDSLFLENPYGVGLYPLFKLFVPNANNNRKIEFKKGFCLTRVDNLDSIIYLFSKSSLFPNTTFLVSNANFGIEFRDVYAIDNQTLTQSSDSNQDSSLNIVKVFNNKVMEASSILRNEIEKGNDENITKLVNCDEIRKLIPFMNNNQYLKIGKVKITTR